MKSRLPKVKFPHLMFTLWLVGAGACPARAVVPVPGPAPTFNPPAQLNIDRGGTMPVQADFNQDGVMDIAVTDPVMGTVDVLLGPTFTTRRFFQTVPANPLAQPVYLAVGDFDKDGKPDLVVVNKQDQSASVLKNTSSGGTLNFSITVIPIPLPAGATGIQPVQVAAGDVDGDGNLDFVTANYLSNTIAVFFGNGDAVNFTAHPVRHYQLPGACGASNPNSIVLGDLDRDGKLDAIVGANNCSQLFVLVNTGVTGSADPYAATVKFPNPMPYTIGANCVAEGVADMNGDLSPDVVVSDNGGVGGSAVISILFGNGDGFLGTAPCGTGGCGKGMRLDISGVGQSPQGVVLGDVNGDSYTDIAVVDDSHGPTDGIKVFLGNGLGCFGVAAPPAPPCGTWAPVVLVPGTLPRGIGMGDVNGDGKPDLYVANSVAPGVSLFTNTLSGATACAAVVAPPTCITSHTPCVGMDVNISGVVLPTGGAVRGYSLTLRLSSNLSLCAPNVVKGEYLQGIAATRTTLQQVTHNPDGSYTIDEAVLTPPPGAGCGATDLSGRLFTVFLTSSAGTIGTGTVTVTGLTLRDCNNGALTAFPCPATMQGTITIKWVDPLPATNLVVRQKRQGNKPGQTTEVDVSWTLPTDPTSPPATTTLDVWRAPFTGAPAQNGSCSFANGYPDYQGVAPPAPTNLYPVANPVTFGTRTDIPLANGPVAVAIGDVNPTNLTRDCKLDLVTANGTTSNISVLPGTGGGAFGSKTDFTAGTGPNSVAIGDIDGDGRLDIVVTNSGSGNVSAYMGNGLASLFTGQVTFAAGTNPSSVAMGDLNGDGKPDLAIANNGSGNVSVLINTTPPPVPPLPAIPTFAPQPPLTAGSGPISVGMGDLNGDGKLDIVVANKNSANVSVFLATGGTPMFAPAPSSPFVVGSNPTSVAIGDVNGDGNLDVVATLAGPPAKAVVLLGTGTGTLGLPTPFDVGGGPLSVALADMNGDSRLDIVTANSTGNSVSVLLNTGSGFGSRTDVAVANGPVSVALGDVTGDGKPDVVTASPGPTLSLSVLPNMSNSTSPWVRVATLPGTSTSFGDVNFPLLGPGPLKQRGYWYYSVVRVDQCGTPSALLGPPCDALSGDNGTLNYHLGDVTTNALVMCQGDNSVDIASDFHITQLKGAYINSLSIPLGDPRGCWDIGPTASNNTSYFLGRPTRDRRIGPEDVLVFGANLNLVSTPHFAALPAAEDHDELTLEAPVRVAKGERFMAVIDLKGAGDLRGIDLALGWDAAVAEPTSVGAGALATTQDAWVLSNGPGKALAAVLGADRAGFQGDGPLATVEFRAKADGTPGVVIKDAQAWNMSVERVYVSGARQPPPSLTALELATPNPFDRTTTLSFTLAVDGRADLAIYSLDGRRVKTLASGTRPAGDYRLAWNGTDESGRPVAPGMFFARLLTAHGHWTRTLVKIQ